MLSMQKSVFSENWMPIHKTGDQLDSLIRYCDDEFVARFAINSIDSHFTIKRIVVQQIRSMQIRSN